MVVVFISAVVLLISLLYSTKHLPAFCAFFGGAGGLAVLCAAKMAGFGVGFNPFTCGVCAVLGAPGAVGLLGMKILLKC